MNAGQLALHLARLIVSGWGVHSAAEDLATQFSGERIGNPTTVRFTPLQAAVLNVLLGIRDRPMSSAAREHFRKRSHAVFQHVEKALAPLYAEPTAAVRRGTTPPFDVRSYVPPSALDSIPVSIVDARPPMKREPDEPIPADIQAARVSRPHTVTQVPAQWSLLADQRLAPRYDALRASTRVSPEQREQLVRAHEWLRRQDGFTSQLDGALEGPADAEKWTLADRWQACSRLLARVEAEAVARNDASFPDHAAAAIVEALRSHIERRALRLTVDESAFMLWLEQLPTSRFTVKVGPDSWYAILAVWSDYASESVASKRYTFTDMLRDSYTRLGALTALNHRLRPDPVRDVRGAFSKLYFVSRLLTVCAHYARQPVNTFLESVVFQASDPFVDAIRPAQIRQERPGLWALSYVGEAAPTDPVDVALYEFGRLSGPSWYDVAARLLTFRDTESVLMFDDAKAAIPYWPRKRNPSSETVDVQESLSAGRWSNPASDGESLVNYVEGQAARVAEQIVQWVLMRVDMRIQDTPAIVRMRSDATFVIAVRDRVLRAINAFVAPYWNQPYWCDATVDPINKTLHVPKVNALWLHVGKKRVDDRKYIPLVTRGLNVSLALAYERAGDVYRVLKTELKPERQKAWRQRAEKNLKAVGGKLSEEPTQETAPEATDDTRGRRLTSTEAVQRPRMGWVSGSLQVWFPTGEKKKSEALLRGAWALLKTRDGYNITHAPTGKMAFPVKTRDEGINAMNALFEQHPELLNMQSEDDVLAHKPFREVATRKRALSHFRHVNPDVSDSETGGNDADGQESLNLGRWSNPASDESVVNFAEGQPARVAEWVVQLVAFRAARRVAPDDAEASLMNDSAFMTAVRERVHRAIDAFAAPFWNQPVYQDASYDLPSATVTIPKIDALWLQVGNSSVNDQMGYDRIHVAQLAERDVQLGLAYFRGATKYKLTVEDITPSRQEALRKDVERRVEQLKQEKAEKAAATEKKTSVSARTSFHGFYSWPGQSAFERERALKPVHEFMQATYVVAQLTIHTVMQKGWKSALLYAYALLVAYHQSDAETRHAKRFSTACLFEAGYYLKRAYFVDPHFEACALKLDETSPYDDAPISPDDPRVCAQDNEYRDGVVRMHFDRQRFTDAALLLHQGFGFKPMDDDWSDPFRIEIYDPAKQAELRLLVERELQPDRMWRATEERWVWLWLASVALNVRFHLLMPQFHFGLSSYPGHIAILRFRKHLLQSQKVECVNAKGEPVLTYEFDKEKQGRQFKDNCDLSVWAEVLRYRPIVNLRDVFSAPVMPTEPEPKVSTPDSPPVKKITAKEMMREAHKSKKELLASIRPPAEPPAPKPSRKGFVPQDVVLSVRKDKPPMTVPELVRGAWGVGKVNGQWQVTHAPSGMRAFDVRTQNDGIAAINELAETVPDVLHEPDPQKVAMSKGLTALARRLHSESKPSSFAPTRTRNPDEPPVATGAFRNEPGVTTPLLWRRTFEAWEAVEETEQGHLSQKLLVEAIFEKLRSFESHIHAYADDNREVWQDHVRKRVREILTEKLIPHFHQRFIRPQKDGRAPQVCRIEGVAPWAYINGKPYLLGLLADDGFVYSASVVRAGSSPEAFALFERATMQQSAGKKADATEIVGLATPEEQRRFLLERVPKRGLDALPRKLAKQITESIHAWWTGEAHTAVNANASTYIRHDAVVSHFYYEHNANPNRGVTEQAPCALTLKLGSSGGTIALTFWGFTHDGRSTLEALGFPQTLAYVECQVARRSSQYPSQDVRDKRTSFIGTAEEVTNAALSDVVKVLGGWYDAAAHRALADSVARRYKIFTTPQQAAAEPTPTPSAPAPERELVTEAVPPVRKPVPAKADALRERFIAHVSTPPGDMHGVGIPSGTEAVRIAWHIREALRPWMGRFTSTDRSYPPHDVTGEFAKQRGTNRHPSLDPRLTLEDAPEFMRLKYDWRNDETNDKFFVSVTLSGFANGNFIVPSLLACTDIFYEKTYQAEGGTKWMRLREKWLPDMLVASPDEVIQTLTGIITTNLDKAEVPRIA